MENRKKVCFSVLFKLSACYLAFKKVDKGVLKCFFYIIIQNGVYSLE